MVGLLSGCVCSAAVGFGLGLLFSFFGLPFCGDGFFPFRALSGEGAVCSIAVYAFFAGGGAFMPQVPMLCTLGAEFIGSILLAVIGEVGVDLVASEAVVKRNELFFLHVMRWNPHVEELQLRVQSFLCYHCLLEVYLDYLVVREFVDLVDCSFCEIVDAVDFFFNFIRGVVLDEAVDFEEKDGPFGLQFGW